MHAGAVSKLVEAMEKAQESSVVTRGVGGDSNKNRRVGLSGERVGGGGHGTGSGESLSRSLALMVYCPQQGNDLVRMHLHYS